jgi:hypothetical protein
MDESAIVVAMGTDIGFVVVTGADVVILVVDDPEVELRDLEDALLSAPLGGPLADPGVVEVERVVVPPVTELNAGADADPALDYKKMLAITASGNKSNVRRW